MSKLKQLREQLNAKAAEIRNHAENTSDWDEAAQATFDAMEVEHSRIEARISAIQKTLDRDAAQAAIDNPPEREPGADPKEPTEQSVFDSFLRNGLDGLSAEEKQFRADQIRERRLRGDLSRGTDSEGGHLAPEEFSNTLLERLKAFGGMRASGATILTTATGNSFEWPTMDETSEKGELVAENASVATGDPAFGNVIINAYKYSSKSVAVPFELLQDSRIDIESLIQNIFRVRLGRITNEHFTVGTGSGQPQGAVVGSVLGKTGATGQTTSVIYDDLVDLQHSVDPAYRESGDSVGWMFHDKTLAILKKLKDGDGRPLWLPGVAGGDPATILENGYTINQDMAEMAASAKSILFGDFSKYMIRQVMDFMFFRMTDSKYTEKGQVGFLAFMRCDGKIIAANNECIKHYANAAS